MALTPAQQTLLDRIHAVLAADPVILAAWLGGSLGAGGGDRFSDLDVVVLTAAGATSRAGWLADREEYKIPTGTPVSTAAAPPA